MCFLLVTVYPLRVLLKSSRQHLKRFAREQMLKSAPIEQKRCDFSTLPDIDDFPGSLHAPLMHKLLGIRAQRLVARGVVFTIWEGVPTDARVHEIWLSAILSMRCP